MVLQIHSIIVFLHVVALAIGLGGAVLADWIVLSQLTFRTVTPASASRLSDLSRAVMIGLVLLWITGAALIAYQMQTAPQQLLTNQKVWAKIAIVAILTVNALLLHGTALPQVAMRVGQPLFEQSWRVLVPATLFAAVSATSWIFAAYLGIARELNHTVTVYQVFDVFVPAIILAWMVTLSIGLMGREATSRTRWPIDSHLLCSGSQELNPGADRAG